MNPKFKHDCERCTFLGTVRIDPKCGCGTTADLYVTCNEPGQFTLRFSSDGWDYVVVNRARMTDYLLGTM